MGSSRIDPDREYTARDMMTAGLGIGMAAFIFLGVAYVFATTPGDKNTHAAWFFGVTFVFILTMGAGTFIYGLRKRGSSTSSNDTPSASSSSPSGETNNTP